MARLMKEIGELYDRNLITMDEWMHFYKLIMQHDLQLMHSLKVFPTYVITLITWNAKRIEDPVKRCEYLEKKLDKLMSMGGYADNATRPYKMIGKPPFNGLKEVKEMFKIEDL